MRALNLPNTLTVTRIVLIPVFITSIQYKRYDYALYFFIFAAITDLLDGLLARLKDQKTQLGTILDPLADKFLLVTSYLFFAYYGWLPRWLTVIVISRDIVIITGWVLIYFITHALMVKPSLFGKISTNVQLALICFVLLNLNFGVLDGIKIPLVWGTAAITTISGIHYIFIGLRMSYEQ